MKYFITLFFSCILCLHANEKQEILNTVKAFDQEHAKHFGSLLVQDVNGRIKPMNTLSIELLNKISRKNSLFGLDANQVVLGMITASDVYKRIRLVHVKHPQIKALLGLELSVTHFAYTDAFNYKLKEPFKLYEAITEATRKRPAQQNSFDKELLKINERLNLLYTVFNKELFTWFPRADHTNLKWYAPLEAIKKFPKENATEIQLLLKNYFNSVYKGVQTKDWQEANAVLAAIKMYQYSHAKAIIPSQSKIKTELFLNQFNVFENLVPYYLLCGFILLVLTFVEFIKPFQRSVLLTKAVFILLALGFVFHSLGLGLRSYIAGHAPWSDSYESMIFIAWAIVLAGLYFARHSHLSLSVTGILAGITLFVAHLSWMDPQITNLVPVLKSYWLNIHVSVITASYGFLGLSALLGFLSLLFFSLLNPKYKSYERLYVSIKEAGRINEMSLMIGLSLLVVGNFLGGVWANESWGRYWGWDPKETWAWISILVYTIILHLRFVKGLDNEYVLASSSLVGFSSILMTYFGVNFYLSGLHSYAGGDPLPIPTWIYFTLLCVIILLLLAFRKRRLMYN